MPGLHLITDLVVIAVTAVLMTMVFGGCGYGGRACDCGEDD